MSQAKGAVTWHDSVKEALEVLGGSAHLSVLYEKVRKLREAKGIPLNLTFQCTIRRTLQQGREFFRDGTHPGTWHLKPDRPNETRPTR